MAGQTRPVWDFEDVGDWWTRADADAIAPIVAVPTTAGTGSEVGRAGVVTDEATHTKKVIFHPKMMPKVVICDPELTVGMPPVITAGTGMDALAHCLEAYSAEFYHPMAAGIAVEGMRLVFENLPKAVKDGNEHRGARAHDERRGDGRDRLPEGARRDPFAVASGRRALRHASRHDERRLHALRARLQPLRRSRRRSSGLPAISELPGGFDGFLKAVLKLREEIGVPHTLAGLKVDASRRDEIAEMAIVDPTAGGNPVKLTKEGALKIFDSGDGRDALAVRVPRLTTGPAPGGSFLRAAYCGAASGSARRR